MWHELAQHHCASTATSLVILHVIAVNDAHGARLADDVECVATFRWLAVFALYCKTLGIMCPMYNAHLWFEILCNTKFYRPV